MTNLEADSKVRRIREEVVPAKAKVRVDPPVEMPLPTTPQSPTPPEPHLMEVLVAAFGAAGLALSARALLLLAIIGGFSLALRNPTVLSLVELGIYCLGVVAPVALLEWRRGRE